MPSYNPVTKKFQYAASDEKLVENARRLFSAVAEYGADNEVKQSATTAFNAAQFVLTHIRTQRSNGK